MKRFPGLIRRGHRWSLRYRLSKTETDRLGRPELVRTTGVGSLEEANRIAPLLLVEMRQAVDRAMTDHTKGNQAESFPALDVPSGRDVAAVGTSRGVQALSGTISPRPSGIGNVAAFRRPAEWAAMRIEDAKVSGLAPKTITAKERALRKFCADVGSDIDLLTFTRRQATAYVHEVIARWQRAPKTKELHVEQVRELFTWLEDRADLQGNPFSRQVAKLSPGRKGRLKTKRGYREGELLTLLRSPFPTGTHSALILFAVYSGARLNEIANCHADDIIGDVEGWQLREAKNQNSVRAIPFHPIVRPLARKMLETSWDGYLLSGLKPAREGWGRGDRLSEWYSKWRKVIGLSDPALTLHSLRNTFITAAQRVLTEAQTAKLVGHKAQTMTQHYTDDPEWSELRQWVAMVGYGGKVDAVARGVVEGQRGNPVCGRVAVRSVAN